MRGVAFVAKEDRSCVILSANEACFNTDSPLTGISPMKQWQSPKDREEGV
jgi:hypothetical protein